ncbi:hypothetical protein [Pseudomonas fluorescens]|uniref:hypothetical protein n=1 Tax=Pseudomonas fluorescens TaxID=294 RepID=UPI000F83251D|nr:hypothetical protein [Pseudomonas fluorescens]
MKELILGQPLTWPSSVPEVWLNAAPNGKPVGAAAGCDLLMLFLQIKIKRSQPSAAPTGCLLAVNPGNNSAPRPTVYSDALDTFNRRTRSISFSYEL